MQPCKRCVPECAQGGFMLVKRIKVLDDIDPSAWEHPADKAALSALKQLAGLDQLVKLLVSNTTERSMRLMHTASSVRVGPRQFPRIHAILSDIMDVFGLTEQPEVYVTQSPFFNAETFGVDKPFIILNSSIVRTFSDEELKVVVAHEMGHVMSGHALYKTLVWMLANISLKAIPGAELLVLPIQAALAEWNRKSELTADRAALLATQNEEASFNVLMRMAGGDDLGQVNINEFFQQAQEYEDKKGLVDSIHKLLNQVWLSHPYPVVRLKELKTWSVSGTYAAILSGHYPHRSAHSRNASTAQEDIKEGFEYYTSSVKDGEDPLSRLASTIGAGLGTAASGLEGILKDILAGKKQE